MSTARPIGINKVVGFTTENGENGSNNNSGEKKEQLVKRETEDISKIEKKTRTEKNGSVNHSVGKTEQHPSKPETSVFQGSVRRRVNLIPKTEKIGKFDETISEVDITKCPICKNTLETPKELTCLHTFCERCISDYLEKAKGNDQKNFRFRCPECHEIQGTFPTDIIETISRSLPTNHFISSLLSTTPSPICRPCSKGNKSTPGTYWCTYCADALCDDHNDYHNEVTSPGVHTVCKIEDAQKQQDTSYPPARCHEHPTKLLSKFCKEHRACICDDCRKTTHKNCINIITIEEEADHVCEGELSDNIWRKLLMASDHVTHVIDELQKNTRELETNNSKCIDAIQHKRKSIENHLNQLEKKLLAKLFKMFNTRVQEIDSDINGFELRRNTMHHYRNLLNVIFEKGTSIQVFMETPDVAKTIHVLSEKMSHRSSKVQTSTFEVTFNEDIKNIHSLGRIIDHESPMAPLTSSESVVEITVNKRKTSNTSKLPSFRGNSHRMGFLAIRYPSSKLVGGTNIQDNILVADYTSKEIRAYHKDGTRNETLSFHLKGNPWDIAPFPKNMDRGILIYTMPHISKFAVIQHPTMEAIPEKEVHSTSSSCYGVTCADGVLVFACMRFLEVWLIGAYRDPTFDSRLTTVGQNVQYVHAMDKNRIYYSDSIDKGGVQCINLDNTLLFQYTHENLVKPRGISTDSIGNVFVAGYKSNNIHKISIDGELMQIIVPRISTFTKPCVLIECEETVYCVYSNHKVIPLFL